MDRISPRARRTKATITPEDLLTHITALSSDKCAGRLPADVGEGETLSYFEQHFASLAAPWDVQRQAVDAVEIHCRPTVSFVAGGQDFHPELVTDYVAASKKQQAKIAFNNSEVIFVGYGIDAPECNWDDYKGLDVAGKTLLMLCGDPIRPEFRNDELTYYGRWTYKYEEAGRRGAAAVFLIHTDRAGYGWDVVERGFGGKEFGLKSANTAVRAGIDGWLTLDAGKKLLQMCGHDFDSLNAKAQEPDFKPVSIGAVAHGDLDAKFKDCVTSNFVATLRGSDPLLADECVVFTAHWDHLGHNETGVMSGAVDNGTGLAACLSVAKALSELTEPFPRSVIIMLPTLEEQNLLGSRYFIANPPAPYTVPNMLAVLNFEMLAPWGRSRQVASVCKGHTSLDGLLDNAAAAQGREIVAEPEPQKGYLYRSDHLPFMHAGVPALAIFFSAMDFMQRRLDFISNDYHMITDKVKPDWDLQGAADDTALLLEVGKEILQSGYRATWNAMSEFNPTLSRRV